MGKLLSDSEVAFLEKSLFYLKMNELRNICLQLNIPQKERKVKLIPKILFFINTGKIASNLFSLKTLLKNSLNLLVA